jgi:hypothetical protein
VLADRLTTAHVEAHAGYVSLKAVAVLLGGENLDIPAQ